MTTAAISVTLGTALTGPGGNLTGEYASKAGPSADVAGNAATALTDYDIFGAALVAITGDTYSSVTHQWTTGGSTGLTHAQVVTLMALLNTTATAMIATNNATAADVTLIINQATVTSGNALRHILRKLLTDFANFGIVSGQ